jgi:hypothetical protein
LTAPQQPSNPGPNATFLALGALGLLNPDQTPEIHDTNNNLLSAAIHTPLVKHVILDESGHQLEDVIKALGEADDTSCIPNSYVPGVSEHLLAKSASTDYSKIMTSVAINCVRCNRRTTIKVAARRDGLEWAQGVIVNKLEETEKIYGHKVPVETALESRVWSITVNKDWPLATANLTPASEADLALSSAASCL